MTSRIQIRRDTDAAWSSANKVLASGEFGLATTTGTLKLGDGVTAWNSLVSVYTPWTTYSPTWTSLDGVTTGVVGTGGSLAGKYMKVGKTVDFVIRLKIGSSGTTIPTTQWRFSLPVAPVTNVTDDWIFSGLAVDSSPSAKYLASATNNSSYANHVVAWSAATLAAITSTAPITWASGDTLTISGRYESAT